jgi:hypothetical protein
MIWINVSGREVRYVAIMTVILNEWMSPVAGYKAWGFGCQAPDKYLAGRPSAGKARESRNVFDRVGERLRQSDGMGRS